MNQKQTVVRNRGYSQSHQVLFPGLPVPLIVPSMSWILRHFVELVTIAKPVPVEVVKRDSLSLLKCLSVTVSDPVLVPVMSASSLVPPSLVEL